MRRSYVLLASVLVTLMACSEPSAPSGLQSPGYDVASSQLVLRGIVELTHDAEPRLALRMSEILVLLNANESAEAGLSAAVGATVTVTGNFSYGTEFRVSSYQIYAAE